MHISVWNIFNFTYIQLFDLRVDHFYFLFFLSPSALVVRLLTNRFIWDYDVNLEAIYRHSMEIDDDHYVVEVMDTGPNVSGTPLTGNPCSSLSLSQPLFSLSPSLPLLLFFFLSFFSFSLSLSLFLSFSLSLSLSFFSLSLSLSLALSLSLKP